MIYRCSGPLLPRGQKYEAKGLAIQENWLRTPFEILLTFQRKVFIALGLEKASLQLMQVSQIDFLSAMAVGRV